MATRTLEAATYIEHVRDHAGQHGLLYVTTTHGHKPGFRLRVGDHWWDLRASNRRTAQAEAEAILACPR